MTSTFDFFLNSLFTLFLVLALVQNYISWKRKRESWKNEQELLIAKLQALIVEIKSSRDEKVEQVQKQIVELEASMKELKQVLNSGSDFVVSLHTPQKELQRQLIEMEASMHQLKSIREGTIRHTQAEIVDCEDRIAESRSSKSLWKVITKLRDQWKRVKAGTDSSPNVDTIPYDVMLQIVHLVRSWKECETDPDLREEGRV